MIFMDTDSPGAFNGMAVITWFEHGHLNHKQMESNAQLHDELKELTTRIPKAHVSWLIINFDEKSVQAARGQLDA